MLPSVSLPTSPYWAASGISPMTTLSSTIQITRRKVIGLLECAFDAGAQLIDEFFRQETVHAAGDASLLVEHDCGRNGADLEQTLQAVVEIHGRFAPLL